MKTMGIILSIIFKIQQSNQRFYANSKGSIALSIMFLLIFYILWLRKQPPEMFCKKGAACNFINKETLAQVFSCEFCEIFKNTCFTEHLWTTASVVTFSVLIFGF